MAASKAPEAEVAALAKATARLEVRRAIDDLGENLGQFIARNEFERRWTQLEVRYEMEIARGRYENLQLINQWFERRSLRGRWRRVLAWLRAPLEAM